MKEQSIQKQIKDFLTLNGYKVVKINNVGIKKPDGSYIPTHQRGVSDLLCCAPDGRFVAIEVKRKGEKLTETQKEFLRHINRLGGIGIAAWSLEEVIEDLGL